MQNKIKVKDKIKSEKTVIDLLTHITLRRSRLLYKDIYQATTPPDALIKVFPVLLSLRCNKGSKM